MAGEWGRWWSSLAGDGGAEVSSGAVTWGWGPAAPSIAPAPQLKPNIRGLPRRGQKQRWSPRQTAYMVHSEELVGLVECPVPATSSSHSLLAVVLQAAPFAAGEER